VSLVGKKNIYRCSCGAQKVTVDRDAGVTPFTLPCDDCPAYMQSAFYRVDQALEPAHEWYKPMPHEAAAKRLSGEWSEAMLAHIARGGLVLRAIETPASRKRAKPQKGNAAKNAKAGGAA